MSAETATWLNTNTLIGFTAVRGNAWHYREELQGEQSNHYEGAIPVQDVRDRLFYWKPVEGDVQTTYVTADGVTTITDPTRKTIIRPGVGVLYVPKKSFTIHDYDTWLIRTNEQITDSATGADKDSLQISSAGLLKQGAVAWVQFELPETVKTPEGVDFRPFLSAATSLDGSLSSTFTTGAQVIVCDNTLSAALGDVNAKQIKIRHSRNSLGRIDEAREALGLVVETSETFSAQVKALCEIKVSDKAWAEFLKVHVGVPAADASPRSKTITRNKWEALRALYNNDNRVSPWKGTAFGVVQAVNTYTHHVATVRGASLAERNAERAITGKVDALDASTLETLQKVLASV
jgi:phage/plasmid-like protein (TIGR03299 family)